MEIKRTDSQRRIHWNLEYKITYKTLRQNGKDLKAVLIKGGMQAKGI